MLEVRKDKTSKTFSCNDLSLQTNPKGNVELTVNKIRVDNVFMQQLSFNIDQVKTVLNFIVWKTCKHVRTCNKMLSHLDDVTGKENASSKHMIVT